MSKSIAQIVIEYVASNPSGYVHPETHPATIIEQDTLHQFSSIAEKTKLAGIETSAEVNNISDVNAGLLTGGQEITLHKHAGGSSDPWTIVKLDTDFTTSLATNTNVTGFNFTPLPNKTYLIFGYFLLRTATATVGARPGVAWPSGLTDGVMRAEASNALTTSALRMWGAKTTQNAASTGLATTVDSHWGSLDGIMITASNVSGNFQITLASETAGTNVTIKAGSILMYREL